MAVSALRQWLAGNGYQIVSEELLRENRFDYEIIVAEPGRGCIALNSCTSARC
jgi:tRNA A22 N-methylase